MLRNFSFRDVNQLFSDDINSLFVVIYIKLQMELVDEYIYRD